MLKITKAVLNNEKILYYSPQWVSNGHWAIPRAVLDPNWASPDVWRTIASDLTEKPEEQLTRAFDRALKATRKWTLTGWTWTGRVNEASCSGRAWPKGTTVRAAVDETGARLYLDAKYCDWLGLSTGDELYAKTASDPVRFQFDGQGAILMPVNGDLIPQLPTMPEVAAPDADLPGKRHGERGTE